MLNSNLLQRFSIGPDLTHIAIVTFDSIGTLDTFLMSQQYDVQVSLEFSKSIATEPFRLF